MKKKVVNKKPVSKNKSEENNVLKYFFIGIVIVVIIQSLFMFGGMILEKRMNMNITGIPSSIGLTIVLLIGLFLYKKSEFILLGSFSLAFISPLLLLLIVVFKAMAYTKPHMYFSIAYLILLITIVWAYYVNRIMKGKI
ncbi:MAG: hypothetical protein WC867_03335 [Candidatus Pacearchaeota archaeon]|jgi:hypothetical protein